MGKVSDIIISIIFGVAIITNLKLYTGGAKYEIDNHKVKDGNTYMNTIVEYTGEDKIRYSVYSNSDSKELTRVYINGERYTSKDTLVFEEAQKRYNYLKGQIDSINKVRKESELQKKLDKERERTEKALELLGK